MDTGSTAGIARGLDLEKYRLRRFVERLIDMGEVDVHDDPVPLTALSEIIEASERAQLFRRAGPERVEIAAKTAGSRKRLAAAFDTTQEQVGQTYLERLSVPQYPAPTRRFIRSSSREATLTSAGSRSIHSMRLTAAAISVPRSTTRSIRSAAAATSAAGA
jgi:3-polyprenyl-4-hydroxybenzoate decarboxylase